MQNKNNNENDRTKVIDIAGFIIASDFVKNVNNVNKVYIRSAENSEPNIASVAFILIGGAFI